MSCISLSLHKFQEFVSLLRQFRFCDKKGLAAAKAAGMECIATKSGYTADDNFSNADAVFDCIGDSPEERFDLAFCGSLLKKQYVG
ncbi:hypothetical protein FXO38_35945 [Capsicum annuum]|nr:hypothetical protein FXO38_35945 [Capsicum annuum]